MKERIYLINLYDIYGTLLDEKKQKFFEYYYFDNLSLKEISENLDISRNGVHKHLKNIEAKLKFYESKLNFYEKKIKLNKIISDIKDENIKKKLEKISW